VSPCFSSLPLLVKEKTSRHRQKGKNMKLEEVNTRTKEAVDFLVAALESGHSEVLTAYIGAMAKFHTYSFGNIMLIARQRAVTCCYTSLESMNMRSCALLEASDGA
jgi:hypothetical protein